MSANKEETLQQFCDVTGADEDRSRFFLESSNWQLEVALSSFYEHGGNADEAPTGNQPAAASIPTLSDSDMESPTESPVRTKKEKKVANPKFGTIGTLQQDSSSEDEGQAFYAGGSERSGQQILGPSKGRKDIVTEMFKSVKERGAVVFEDEPSSTRGRGGGAFSGVGYRLGQTAEDHEEVAANPTGASGPLGDRSRSVRLRLYREGFTVDGGALRHYADPENAQFLSCIRRGEVPSELSGAGGEVRVSLEDRRHEECPRQLARPQPFTGKGQMLGSPTPAVVGAAPANAGARADHHRAAQDQVLLDDAQPITTIQFRLADGSRITGRFNHSHTVADLQLYVSRAEPAYQHQTFALLTTFPSAELSDPTATLAQANLLNTTLLQRLK